MLIFEVVGQGATTKIYSDGNTAIKLYLNALSDEADNEAECQRFACNARLWLLTLVQEWYNSKNGVMI